MKRRSDYELQKEILALANKPGFFARIGMVFFLMSVLFFSGTLGIGILVISEMNKGFADRALDAKAEVVHISEKKKSIRSEETSDVSGHGNQIIYEAVLGLRYEDQAGNVYDARVNAGENSLHRTGDMIDVLYDPENPERVILAEDAYDASILHRIAYIALSVFVAALFMLYFISQKKTSQTK